MASLRKQLRAQQAQTTTARGREVELRLTNEGLMEEITRWKRQAHQEATAAQEHCNAVDGDRPFRISSKKT